MRLLCDGKEVAVTSIIIICIIKYAPDLEILGTLMEYFREIWKINSQKRSHWLPEYTERISREILIGSLDRGGLKDNIFICRSDRKDISQPIIFHDLIDGFPLLQFPNEGMPQKKPHIYIINSDLIFFLSTKAKKKKLDFPKIGKDGIYKIFENSGYYPANRIF